MEQCARRGAAPSGRRERSRAAPAARARERSSRPFHQRVCTASEGLMPEGPRRWLVTTVHHRYRWCVYSCCQRTARSSAHCAGSRVTGGLAARGTSVCEPAILPRVAPRSLSATRADRRGCRRANCGRPACHMHPRRWKRRNRRNILGWGERQPGRCQRHNLTHQ